MDQHVEHNHGIGARARYLHNNLEEWMAGLTYAVVAGIERQTTKHDLTAMEFTMLRAFLEQRERTFSQLAEAVPVDNERLAQLVGNLIDRGLLQQRSAAADPHTVLLALTARGRYIAWRLNPRVEAEGSRLLAGVSAEEMATLSSVVSRVVANQAALEQAGSQ